MEYSTHFEKLPDEYESLVTLESHSGHFMDVQAWLRHLALEQYVDAFAGNDVDRETLVKLTAEDLKDIGVTSVGHRRKLLDAIAHLGADIGAPATSFELPESASEREAERRQLTVMFCDLVGSTALAERLDPEDLRAIIGSYQDSLSGEITRFDGHVARFMGDGALVYFGWPTAHEDDAERAVLSGLSVVDAIGRLATPDGEPLEVRVGIATGLVVVGDLIGEGAAQEEAVVGVTPNLAARLQGIAVGNTVVIADSTRALLGERFAFEDFGPQELRGASEPIHVWRVIRPVEAASRFEAIRGPRLTPLVGRTEELDLLLRRWATAKAGAGQVVLLTGEAGIGKSRIAHTLREQIAQDPHVRLLYQCSPYHTNSALYPFVRQLERAAGLEREDTDEQKLDKLEALLGQSIRREHEVSALIAALLSIASGTRYPSLTMSSQKQKEDTLSVLLEQVGGLAKRQPVLLVFEDLHWVDPTSHELLDLIVEQVQRLPVLVIVTYRPEYAPPWVGQAHVTLVALNRLSRDLSATMVRELSGHKGLPLEVLQQIVIKTDGIPLFVEELTKTVLDSGLLVESQDGYTMASRLPEHAIPATLKDSLMARLDQFGPIREVAQIGAVIGREFPYRLLAEVTTLPDNALDEALERLSQSELIFRRGVSPNASYLFKHALVQDAAYESLLKSRRQQLHARIAEVIEEQFPETTKTQPELLAHHFAEAGLVEQAITYWKHAGERAMQRSADLEAISHIRKGLDLIQTVPKSPDRVQEELTLHILLGAPLIATKGWASPDVVQTYARARELCHQVGKIRQLFPALRGVWGFHLMRGELQTARELGDELKSVANDFEDSALGLEAHLASGMVSFWLGEFSPAQMQLERVTALYDSRKHCTHAFKFGTDPGAAQLFYLARTLWHLGFPDEALRKGDEALALAKRLGHPHTLAWSMAFAASLHLFRGEWIAVRSQAEEIITLCTEQGFPFWLAWGMVLRGSALGAQGDHAQGIAEIQQGLDAYLATGAAVARPYFLTLLAEAHGRAEQAESGLTILAQALEEAEIQDNRCSTAEMHRLNGELLLMVSEERKQEAAYCFQKAIDVAQSQHAKSAELRAAVSLSRLWQRQGKHSEARDHLVPIYDWFTEGFDTADLKEAKTLLEELS